MASVTGTGKKGTSDAYIRRNDNRQLFPSLWIAKVALVYKIFVSLRPVDS